MKPWHALHYFALLTAHYPPTTPYCPVTLHPLTLLRSS